MTFEEWVVYAFDHREDDYWSEEPALVVPFLTRLWEDPLPHLAPYSDAQINQGLWFLINNTCSNHFFALLEETVPWEARRRCLRATVPLYEKLFAPRCTSHLGHLLRAYPPDMNPLNSVCYMWWDIAPVCGHPEMPDRHEFDAECLEVMRRTLAIPQDACRESALHGLGHWERSYPNEVHRVIDDFVAQNPNLPEALRAYARAARAGCVL